MIPGFIHFLQKVTSKLQVKLKKCEIFVKIYHFFCVFSKISKKVKEQSEIKSQGREEHLILLRKRPYMKNFVRILWGPNGVKEKMVIGHSVPTRAKDVEYVFLHQDVHNIIQGDPKVK